MARSSKKQEQAERAKEQEEKMRNDQADLPLPEARDIPGQEHIHVPPLGELADTTPSSDDEEGRDVLDDDQDYITNPPPDESDADVSDTERELLEESADIQPTQDEAVLRRAELDNVDEDGEPLNETIDESGDDLDVPGSELDDDSEATGGEDEENNPYSLGSDDNDETTEGTP